MKKDDVLMFVKSLIDDHKDSGLLLLTIDEYADGVKSRCSYNYCEHYERYDGNIYGVAGFYKGQKFLFVEYDNTHRIVFTYSKETHDYFRKRQYYDEGKYAIVTHNLVSVASKGIYISEYFAKTDQSNAIRSMVSWLGKNANGELTVLLGDPIDVYYDTPLRLS